MLAVILGFSWGRKTCTYTDYGCGPEFEPASLQSGGGAGGVQANIHGTKQMPAPKIGGGDDNALCKQPPMRREWRALQDRQKNEYIRAVKCLAGVKSRLSEREMGNESSLYDDFPWVHKEMTWLSMWSPLLFFQISDSGFLESAVRDSQELEAWDEVLDGVPSCADELTRSIDRPRIGPLPHVAPLLPARL